MKTFRIIYIMLLSGILFMNAEAHVNLDYPQGGEMFSPGEIVTIKWTLAVEHIQNNWDLYFSIDGGETWDALIFDLPVAVLEYQWTVPDINTSTARIMVLQDNQGTDYYSISGDFSINAEAPNAIKENAGDEALTELLNIFPQPFRERVNFVFELAQPETVFIEICDLNGRKIAAQSNNYSAPGKYTLTWEAGSLKPGTYIYTIRTGERVKRGRIYHR